MKGETVDEVVGAARPCARARCRCCACRPACRRHLRHRRRRARHDQRLDDRGARGRRRPACAWPSTATARSRRARARPTCSRRSASTSARAGAWSSAASRRSGIGFLFAPAFHGATRHVGGRAQGARRAHDLQPARAADQPGRRAPPAHRRLRRRARRADGARARAARHAARAVVHGDGARRVLAQRRRPRSPSCATARCGRFDAHAARLRARRRRSAAASRAATRRTTPRRCARSSAARAARAAAPSS